MPEDYYNDGPEETSASAHKPMMGHKEGESEDSPEQTAVINSSICPGMKPGDELVLKIDRVLENEYEVSYAPPAKDEEGEMGDEGEGETAMREGDGDSEMAAMME